MYTYLWIASSNLSNFCGSLKSIDTRQPPTRAVFAQPPAQDQGAGGVTTMCNYLRFIALLFVLILLGCQPLPAAPGTNAGAFNTPGSGSTAFSEQNSPSPFSSPSPTRTRSSPEQAMRSESLFSIDPGLVGSPTVVARLRISEEEIGWNTIEIGAGKLWLGTNNSTIEVYDPEHGERLRLIRLIAPGKSQISGSVLDIVYDGRYIWAAVSRMDDLSGGLFTIDPMDNAVIGFHFFPPGRMPQALAVTPGRIWVAGHDFFQPFDSDTLQPLHSPIRLSDHMVEDEIHTILYPGGERLLLAARFSSAIVNLYDPNYKPHYSVALGHGALYDGDAIWTATFGVLERFLPELETFPDLKVDLARMWNDPQAYAKAMTSDDENLWILEARGPYLYQHDLASGKYIDRFLILEPESVIRGNTGLAVLAGDDSLWVLTSQELVKVALP
jgi:hypothetical protein